MGGERDLERERERVTEEEVKDNKTHKTQNRGYKKMEFANIQLISRVFDFLLDMDQMEDFTQNQNKSLFMLGNLSLLSPWPPHKKG